MSVYRTEEASVRSVVELSSTLIDGLKRQGWQLNIDGQPTHVARSSQAPANPEVLPFRTTLLHRGGNRYEFFECGEYWELKPYMDTEEPSAKTITILTPHPVNPEDVGKIVERVDAVPQFPKPAPAPAEASNDPPEAPAHLDPNRRVVGPTPSEVPLVGDQVKLAGKVFGPGSSLKDLKWACKFLRIPSSGSKELLWNRLQKECAMNNLKIAVQASDAVVEAYKADVNHGPLPQKPDPHTVMTHELTHIPRMDWCESCQASRSREDAHEVVEPKREIPIVSLDYMFNRTGEAAGDDDRPLTVQLVAVCHTTKYVVCVPLTSKAAEAAKAAVEEVVKMASSLGYEKLVLRADTEPSMEKLCKMICLARTRLGFSTEIEPAVPDSSEHQGVRAERYIDKVRRLGLCLLRTVSAGTKLEIKSSHPLYGWAFRRAAFLLTRFHVHSDGCASFELVHGRKYDSKIAAFGSVVFAQVVPKKKVKGVTWDKAVYLGKSSIGNLSIISSSSGVHYARTIRRASEVYQPDMIVAMRGVVWDPKLDVVSAKACKPVKFRIPEIAVEGGPGPDEAASDPISAPRSPGSSVLHELQNEPLGSAQSASAELIPAEPGPMEVGQVQEDLAWLQRVLDEDRPHGHEEESLACDPDECLEADFSEGFWDDDFVEGDGAAEGELPEASESQSERGDQGMPWEGRPYSDGPPDLPAEELAELDVAMEKKELDRLLAMGVLKFMTESEKADKMKLQSKNVYDWRYRNGWVRRARLVAKEFRFLEPSLTDLYSPASIACSHKLLACLATCNPDLELLSVDITDAYLQVRQRRPTYIQSAYGDLELLFNLPGQRAGSRDWFCHLQSSLDTLDVKSFAGCPSLFATPQKFGLNSHVDDLQILGLKGEPLKLANELRQKGLKLKIDGPVSIGVGSSHFLKKKFQGVDEGIQVVQDHKYAEKLVQILGLEKAHGKKSPLPQHVGSPGEGMPLTSEQHAVYRRCVGILLCISAERPDLQYGVKVLSSRSSQPTTCDFDTLRHLVKYLKLYPVLPITLSSGIPGRSLFDKWNGVDKDDDGEWDRKNQPFGQEHLIEVVTDADWGSKVFQDRRSVSS